MAVSKIQGDPTRSTSWSGSPTGTLAYAGAVTSGNLLVCLTSGGDNTVTISSVADDVNGGNWAQAVQRSTDGHFVGIFYKKNTAAGTPTVTVTLSTGVGIGAEMAIFEFAGGSTLDIDKTSNNGGSSGGTIDPGNLNTALANAVLLVVAESAVAEPTAGTSYTLLNTPNGWDFSADQYRIVSATSNYSAAFGNAPGGTWTAAAANFGEAAAGDTLFAASVM